MKQELIEMLLDRILKARHNAKRLNIRFDITPFLYVYRQLKKLNY